jgi:hypothetical protein
MTRGRNPNGSRTAKELVGREEQQRVRASEALAGVADARERGGDEVQDDLRVRRGVC